MLPWQRKLERISMEIPARWANLAQSLAKAKELKTQLISQDDELIAKIPAIEAALKQLGLGIPLFTELKVIDEQHGYRETRDLVYGKLDNRWQLYVATNDNTSPEQYGETPLASASREDRYLAFHNGIPDLFKNALESIERHIDRRKNAAQTIDELLKVVSIISTKDGDDKVKTDSSKTSNKEVK